jgi:hypothetical protein
MYSSYINKIKLLFDNINNSCSFSSCIQSALGYATLISERTAQQQQPLSVFSTRIITIFNTTQIKQLVNFTIANFNGTCPLEIAMYIHGFNRNQAEALKLRGI